MLQSGGPLQLLVVVPLSLVLSVGFAARSWLTLMFGDLAGFEDGALNSGIRDDVIGIAGGLQVGADLVLMKSTIAAHRSCTSELQP